MSAWAHLPNAPHIDRILEHVAQYPLKWSAAQGAARGAAWSTAQGAARDTAWSAAWSAARNAAWNAARNAARNAAWSAARNPVRNAARHSARIAARDATRNAARDATDALIAWDDCAYLLDLTPETVRGIARVSDSPAAFLLLPAVIALQPEGV